jgi:hypothetical protein
LSLWSLTYMLVDRPRESLAGLLTLLAGMVLYGVDYIKARLTAPARS